jgi:hypothetical protein
MPLWSPLKRVWGSGGKVYNEDVIIIIPIAGAEVKGGWGGAVDADGWQEGG